MILHHTYSRKTQDGQDRSGLRFRPVHGATTLHITHSCSLCWGCSERIRRKPQARPYAYRCEIVRAQHYYEFANVEFPGPPAPATHPPPRKMNHRVDPEPRRVTACAHRQKPSQLLYSLYEIADALRTRSSDHPLKHQSSSGRTSFPNLVPSAPWPPSRRLSWECPPQLRSRLHSARRVPIVRQSRRCLWRSESRVSSSRRRDRAPGQV